MPVLHQPDRITKILQIIDAGLEPGCLHRPRTTSLGEVICVRCCTVLDHNAD